MRHSQYYGMNLPEGKDRFNIEDFNENTELLDDKLYELFSFESTGSSHIADKNNPHSVTKEQVGLENVENKNSAEIRAELTSANVTSALGFTPLSNSSVGDIAFKSSNGSQNEFLRGDGTWASPASSAGGSLFFYQSTEPTEALANTVWIG